MKERMLNPKMMIVLGLAIGVASRLLDIHTEHMGNIFSQMAIWILIGVLISIYSKSAKRAALHVFLFCIGMLITYYAAAVITHGVYNRIFIVGWTIFAFCSPVMAYFAWMAKEKGAFPFIIRIGIVALSLLSSIVLFHGPRIYDFVINGVLVYYLFFKQVQRTEH